MVGNRIVPLNHVVLSAGLIDVNDAVQTPVNLLNKASYVSGLCLSSRSISSMNRYRHPLS